MGQEVRAFRAAGTLARQLKLNWVPVGVLCADGTLVGQLKLKWCQSGGSWALLAEGALEGQMEPRWVTG